MKYTIFLYSLQTERDVNENSTNVDKASLSENEKRKSHTHAVLDENIQ